MKITVKEITGRVYDLLDENREILEERVDYSDPGTQIGPLISALLPEAARQVLKEVPIEDLNECKVLTPIQDIIVTERAVVGGVTGTDPGITQPVSIAKVRWRNDGIGELDLPDDYLRFVHFRMADWEEGLTRLMDYESSACRLRSRRRPDGTFSRRRPGLAVKERGRKKQLMIYGSTPGTEFAELEYVGKPEVNDSSIDLPQGVIHGVCVRLTEMVKAIIGDRNWS